MYNYESIEEVVIDKTIVKNSLNINKNFERSSVYTANDYSWVKSMGKKDSVKYKRMVTKQKM